MDAVINSGPREDSTRVGSAGVVRRQAVDLSPFRRVNQVCAFIVTETFGAKCCLLARRCKALMVLFVFGALHTDFT